MQKKRSELFWVDILVSIEKVKRFSNSFSSKEEFQANDLVVSATMREIKAICKAVNHILSDPTLSYQVHREWPIVADFSSILPQEYFAVDLGEVYTITKKQIYIFETAFIEFIKMSHDDVFFAALSDTKLELKEKGPQESLVYLENIESLLRNSQSKV